METTPKKTTDSPKIDKKSLEESRKMKSRILKDKSIVYKG